MLFASIVEEIQCMIENTDYTLIVSYLDEDADEVEQAVLLCRERKPLGLLFLGGNPEYFKKEFAQVDVPCVLVTNLADQMDFPNLSSVATDDIAAAKCAVDALFDAGHTKIGILGGDIENRTPAISVLSAVSRAFWNMILCLCRKKLRKSTIFL